VGRAGARGDARAVSGGRDPVRVGLLGAGAVAQIVHLPIFTERGDVDVLAIADPDGLKAESLASRFGVPRVLDDDALLGDGDVEAVVICAPNNRHESLAVAALEAGKHVLVERPLALTAEGAQRVLDAARAADRCLAVGMNHRYRPDAGALRAFISGGELGTITAVRASSLTRAQPVVRRTWRQKPEEAGGGAFMDLGVQIVDLAFWLLDYPEVERVVAVLTGERNGIEDGATVLATSRDGIAFSFEVSWSLFAEADRHYARVMGTEGSGTLPPLQVHKQLGGRPVDVTPRQPTPRGGENSFTNAYRRLLDEFVRSVAGECSLPLPEEQVALMAFVEAVYRSAREGGEVRL